MIGRRTLSTLVGALAVVALGAGAGAQTSARPAPASGAFDYYVMTLSWSPGFCDTGGAAKSPEQCAVGSGEGFVVHGLWPDSAYGADPEYCDSSRDVSNPELQAARGLYPALGLARYEYRKHGTCAGLSAGAYFATVRYVREQLVIPEMLRAPRQEQRLSPAEIQQAFLAANANLAAGNMAVTCSHGELEDVRFCISRDLKAFAVCPKVSGHTCYAKSITVAPVR